MSDVSWKVLPDKGSLNRKRLGTKALKFPSCTRKIFFHLNWNRECDEVYPERHDDRYGGRVPSKMTFKGTSLLRFGPKTIFCIIFCCFSHDLSVALIFLTDLPDNFTETLPISMG